MAQVEAKLRSCAQDGVFPPTLPLPACPEREATAEIHPHETEDADQAEAEQAAIIAARLGGVDRFD